MDIRWLDPAHLDERDLAGALAVLAAAAAVDAPDLVPPPSRSRLAALLTHGSGGEPPLLGVVHEPGGQDPAGRVVAVVRLNQPRWGNHHQARVRVTVDPAVRGRGLGRAAFAALLDRARAEGRRLATAFAFEHGPGVAFLAVQGFEQALELVLRRLDLVDLDRAGLAPLLREAERRSAGYELLRMPGAVPAELLAEVAAMTAAINDAPTGGLEIEDEAFPPERIRAYEAADAAAGVRQYRLVARETATGALAGQTIAGVEAERPWLGDQGDTSVVRAHRGHRLGLRLKIEMLRWLAEVEPQLRMIDTDNAADNAHMIGVNAQLGFRVTGRIVEFQRRL